MNRKVEIEMKANAFVGLNGRTSARYRVVGYLQNGEGGWTGAMLTREMVPFGRGGSETEMGKTEAMQVANEWFKIRDETASQLVFGIKL